MVRRSDFENGVRLFAIRTAAFLMMFIGQLLVCTSGIAEQVLQSPALNGVGAFKFAIVSSAVLTSTLLGVLWIPASLKIGGPMVLAGPVAVYVCRQYSSAQSERSQQLYSRVPVQTDAEDVDFSDENAH